MGIPKELIECRQWVGVTEETKIPINPHTGEYASSTNPASWGTFDEAFNCSADRVGFILAKDDPYVVVDLDTKRCGEAGRDLHAALIAEVGSWTERSKSGRGYHIFLKGEWRGGNKNSQNEIEVYSHSRLIVVTGNELSDTPIIKNQSFLDRLAEVIPASSAVSAEGSEQSEDDDEILRQAFAARNGDKVRALYEADWTSISGDYRDDQSTADSALATQLLFYSDNTEQITRLCMASARYRPHKGKAGDGADYWQRTIDKARGWKQANEPPKAEINLSRQLAKSIPNTPKQPLTLPPGLVGDIAQYIEESAIVPSRPIALAAAIGFVGAMVGRQFNISGGGLNQYVLLMAPTGAGKEGAVSGIDRILSEVRKTVPWADEFIGPGNFASGPALAKRMVQQNSFVSVLGEFGHLVKRMANAPHSAPEYTLRAVMLDLYGKSGQSSILRPSVYSNAENNTEAVAAPNFNLVGETTPSTLFEGVDESIVTNGFLPRLLVLEHTGDRAHKNRDPFQSPSPALVKRIADLFNVVASMKANQSFLTVKTSQEATTAYHHLNDTITDDQNSHDKDEVRNQLWSRTAHKTLKLAALIAVGQNHNYPEVSREAFDWAYGIEKAGIELVQERFSSGEVGSGDSKQYTDVVRIIKNYFANQKKPLKEQKDGVIRESHISRRTANLPSFKQDRLGASGARQRVLRDMVEADELRVVDRKTTKELYKHGAKSYTLGSCWEG